MGPISAFHINSDYIKANILKYVHYILNYYKYLDI